MTDRTAAMWEEYDQAAAWCALRRLRGTDGDPLPDGLASDVHEAVNADPEAFAARVRAFAYALAMGDEP